MSGLLGTIFSQGDRAKRHLKGLLSDPVAYLEQTAGLLGDNLNAQRGLLNEAVGDDLKIKDKKKFGQVVDSTLNNVMGFAPVGMMAGVGAKTADKDALKRAYKMEREGAKPEVIWRETGWGRAPGGAWRFEIDDSTARNLFTNPEITQLRDMNGGEWIAPAKFVEKFPNTNEAATIRLRNSMYSDHLSSSSPRLGQSFSHQKLMDAYPDLYKTRTVIKNDMPIGEGGYAEAHDAIVLSPMAGRQADSVMLHEIQHAIQQREGFPGGGTADLMAPLLESSAAKKAAQARALIDSARRYDPLGGVEVLKPGAHKRGLDLERQAQDLRASLSGINEFGEGFADRAYQRLAGEAEARLVQSRMDMTPEQRLQQFPWAADYFRSATGVPINSLLFR